MLFSNRTGRALAFLLLLLFVGGSCAAALVPLPLTQESDVVYFGADGSRLKGVTALTTMEQKADLIVWCAGNQYVAVPDLVAAFQNAQPGVSVGIITMPPELELSAIRAGGWSYQGRDYPGLPDVYGSVSIAGLSATGRIRQYVAYAHNELQLMVPAHNPKGVKDLHDLERADLRVILPNPIDEGIMKVYAKPILVELGIWDALSGGSDCRACAAMGHVYFAAVHHRESPARLENGSADVALVWSTEIEEARRSGLRVEGVALPPEQSARDTVTYFAGLMSPGPHETRARQFLQFLLAPAGQSAYLAHGFVGARPSESAVRELAVTSAAQQ